MSLISIVPLGFMLGAGFEIMQYYLSHTFYINRISDINDVLANGIGIVVGFILAIMYYYFHERSQYTKQSN